ncbi:carboxymuconolactone decarboxylase family protein [Dehalococcoidia bacterium]|nr:carboxymuconolactone decarboxylase family protein [Dehalococcoidia bacterium]MCL0093715.1 carboxymuconolactone decarboxylase family protein [Dehalococcoidia bacterium]
MARVKLVEKDQAPPEVEDLFQRIEANGAKIINLYRAIALSPPMISSFLKLGNSLLNKAELSPKLRELAILRIAKLAGSEYEWTQHVPIAREVGVSRQQVDDVHQWEDSAGFNDEERAVLQYTDEVALNVRAADETFEALRQYLSERSVVELTMSIGYWGMIARVLVPLEIELEEQSVGSARDLLGK